jgi:hypothetical protein
MNPITHTNVSIFGRFISRFCISILPFCLVTSDRLNRIELRGSISGHKARNHTY